MTRGDPGVIGGLPFICSERYFTPPGPVPPVPFAVLIQRYVGTLYVQRRVQARRCTVYKKPGPRYTICFLVRKFSSISWWQEGAVKRDRHATTSGVRLPNYVLKIGAADLRGTLFYRCTYASHEQCGRAVSLHSFCLDLSYKLHITGVSAWSTSIEYIHHENFWQKENRYHIHRDFLYMHASEQSIALVPLTFASTCTHVHSRLVTRTVFALQHRMADSMLIE